ncbi:MAG: SpoIIE family protein phosphatase [Bryobacterales bacterium]|nr:SpoIIE family protein phosphatase [Bryobacterales bacterium]
MAVLQRVVSVCRLAGWPEGIFAGLLATYLWVRWGAPAGVFRLLLEIALTVVGFVVAVRLARRAIRTAVWRLRNRLVVAYLFIAVVPVVLILLLVGIGSYLLTGQIAVYLVSNELEERVDGLAAAARELLATKPGDLPQHMRWLSHNLQERYPGVEFLVSNRGAWRFPEETALALPAGGSGNARGVVLRDGRPHIWSREGAAAGVAVVTAPLSKQVLSRLVPGLGDVTLLAAPLNGTARRPGSSRRPAGVPEQDLASHVPPAANWLDVPVTWFRLTPAVRWEDPSQTRDYPLVVVSRPSAVLRTFFSQRVDWSQGLMLTVFVVVAALFLVVELASLGIGVSLTRTITAAVHGLYEGTNRVMRGEFSHRIEVKGNDQLAELGHSFNRMTENLERLLSVEKEKERLQSELEIAREVQSLLYPKAAPVVEGLEVLAHCSPARTVSGDYYDYLSLTGGRLALAIGDVAGKGISAALLMATVQSSLRTQIRGCLERATAAEDSLAAAHLVSQLNQQLYALTSAEKFATFYFGIYDSRSGELSYTNAGHPPPIVVRNGTALRLETNGIVVGAFPFAEYGESRIALEPGDLLACFTDGLTEPENEYGEMFGEDRLIDLLVSNAGRASSEIMEEVYSAVRLWTASPDAQDDMTMLLARRI